MVPWVRCVRGAGFARVVHTPVHTSVDAVRHVNSREPCGERSEVGACWVESPNLKERVHPEGSRTGKCGALLAVAGLYMPRCRAGGRL
jgi:hypothetical protein